MHVQLHRHVGKLLAKQPDHPRHQISACGLTGSNHQRPALEVVEVIQSPAGLVALAEDAVAVAQQQVASFCELGLSPATVKQRYLQLLFEVLNLKADSGLCHKQAVGRFLEAALADDGPQDAQLIQGEGQIGHGGLPTRAGRTRKL